MNMNIYTNIGTINGNDFMMIKVLVLGIIDGKDLIKKKVPELHSHFKVSLSQYLKTIL